MGTLFASVVLTQNGGDNLILIEQNRETGLYDGRKTAIPLTPLKGGPMVGQDAKKAEGRFIAATEDGETIFVTRGGEGEITEIDASGSKPRRTISLPTKLAAGGYLAVISSTADSFDLGGR